jgi:protoporphyrinogen oxidase
MHDPESHVVIIGGGPTGLTAGCLLAREGWRVSVFEADSYDLGGLARTVSYKGFRFDIGGHRFESRFPMVSGFWEELLEGDLVERSWQSRICYKGQIFPYPRNAADLLPKLGPREAIRSGLSFLETRVRTAGQTPGSFEEWGVRQFGSRLFERLFRNYAAKSWEGAAEPDRTAGRTFRYPRLGPGQMWDQCAAEIRKFGGSVYSGHYVMSLEQTFDRDWTVSVSNSKGQEIQVRAGHVISTTDIRELVHMIQPAVSAHAALAGSSLRYRDFLGVSLILRDFRNLPDQTLDLYDPELKASRLQNYKAWSPEMVPDPAYASYGLEYFRPREDKLWDLSDRELIAFAAKELEITGLARAGEVEDGFVVRQEKAYPIHDPAHASHMQAIRREIAGRYPGLHLAGRNGMHKAHHVDQAMLTGMLTARNILAGEDAHDIWDINPVGELQRPRVVVFPPANGNRPASSSGPQLVPNRIRTGEQLASLDRHLSAFRGPSPSSVGVFQVHSGGAATARQPKEAEPRAAAADEDPKGPPPSAA